jgi:hypothetical protein
MGVGPRSVLTDRGQQATIEPNSVSTHLLAPSVSYATMEVWRTLTRQWRCLAYLTYAVVQVQGVARLPILRYDTVPDVRKVADYVVLQE